MKVLKFGGSSLADSECMANALSIVLNAAADSNVGVVLSAPKGITNHLVRLAERLFGADILQQEIEDIIKQLNSIAEQLAKKFSDFDEHSVKESITNELQEVVQLLLGCALIQNCPPKVKAQIVSRGEIISVIFFRELLKATNKETQVIKPKDFLMTDGHLLDATADLIESRSLFQQHYYPMANISLMPGFIGTNSKGALTLLGRNGSDYSAAILAVCCDAGIYEIWTDVDGVYNSDPSLINEAKPLRNLSYHEAMELSYFGAKVLHPKTIGPLAQYSIPCVIKNSNNPGVDGTCIGKNKSTQRVVKAISNLESISMINLSGPGMKGVVGMASRVFQTMANESVSLVLISQSSSEYSISFCIFSHDTQRAETALNQEFELELANKLLEPIVVQNNLAIVSLVGDGMRHQKGVAAKFFQSLAQANVNIVGIAQDASERSISAVVEQRKCTDAMKVCHQNFFSHKQTIDLFLVGCGVVGSELLEQIAKQQPLLQERNIKLTVYGIANSKGLSLNKDGIDLLQWRENISNQGIEFSIDAMKQFTRDNHLINPVIVDCTSNQEIADSYLSYLDNGFHVVTPNKKANTGSIEYYNQLRNAAQKTRRRFLYETNVGAGLPVVDTLQSLLSAGDQLVQFEGILSGSLSFIFGKLEEGISLSDATAIARNNGFTEPDPREDLSGMDVARKLLIMAREAGMDWELDNIDVESVLPEAFNSEGSIEDFMNNLPQLNESFSERVNAAKDEQKVLRYVGKIEDGVGKVVIDELPNSNPLAGVKDGENAIAIHSQYYQPIPMVLRGYGAGAAVTAAGVFGDIMRTLAWKQEY